MQAEKGTVANNTFVKKVQEQSTIAYVTGESSEWVNIAGFTSTQGCTTLTSQNGEYTYLIVAAANAEKKAVFLRKTIKGGPAGQMPIRSEHTYSGHMNDLASDGSRFYAANYKSDTDKTVGVYSIGLVLTDTFRYVSDNPMERVTSIAYYKQIGGVKYFVLGYGTEYAMCKLQNQELIEISRFQLDISRLERAGHEKPVAQAIYIQGKYLYKVFSYINSQSGVYDANSVAQYELILDGDKIKNTEYQGQYQYDISSGSKVSKCELEDLTAGLNGGFYMTMNEEKNGKQHDRVIMARLG